MHHGSEVKRSSLALSMKLREERMASWKGFKTLEMVVYLYGFFWSRLIGVIWIEPASFFNSVGLYIWGGPF